MEATSIIGSQQFDHLSQGEALKLREKAQDAAQKFENIFLKEMVMKMRENASLSDDGGMFGKGPGSDTYSQWFDDNMSNALSQSGQVGVADVIFDDIERLNAVPTAEQAGITEVRQRADLFSSPFKSKPMRDSGNTYKSGGLTNVTA